MPSPDKKPQTVTEQIEEERLRVWREKRAKIAEASRQERIKQAEAERRERLEAFEAEKTQRIRQAAEKRAQEEAAKLAERMSIARSKIAGRTDIEAARKRLLAFRRHAAKMLALRLALFVICPTLAIAAYLFTIATPFYTSHVQFALTAPSQSTATPASTPFSASPLSREAHLLREVLLSPAMFITLNDKDGFNAHLSAPEIDPVQRVGGPLSTILGSDQSRFVRVSVNGQDGIMSIETKATDPQKAQAFASTMRDFAQNWLAQSGTSDSLRVVTHPTLATAPSHPRPIATLSLAFLTFAGLYAFVSIFGRTLIRHADH